MCRYELVGAIILMIRDIRKRLDSLKSKKQYVLRF